MLGRPTMALLSNHQWRAMGRRRQKEMDLFTERIESKAKGKTITEGSWIEIGSNIMALYTAV